ncbi:hypothetical protein [Streptomyces sp. NPDC127036]|uniref:hypothetical protein n=1 Tax=Streptomyces sp. NPDC127036 TaxID=3347112 RepID=UPI0036642FDF
MAPAVGAARYRGSRSERHAERQFEAERTAGCSRTCPGRDCQTVTATAKEIAAAPAANTWHGPRWCSPCAERAEPERAAQLRADQAAREDAERARWDEVVELTAWARAGPQSMREAPSWTNPYCTGSSAVPRSCGNSWST